MRNYLRQIIGNLVAILVVSAATKGIDYHQNLSILFSASAILAILNTFLKPLIRLLTLPLNVITLGIFGWFINVFILYLVTWLVPGFEIVSFGITIGSTTLVFSGFTAYLVTALVINLTAQIVAWILNRK